MKNPYNKIIIWGLREKYHTHRYIHHSFYSTAKKLGWNVLWVEDDKKNADLVQEGDLVISSEVAGKFIPVKKTLADYHLPIKKGVDYCIHNYHMPEFYELIEPKRRIILQVYSNDAEIGTEKWDTVRFFNREKRILYQPWGTNLLPSEFKKPTYSSLPFVFWIGSVWDNARHQGNISQINELKLALRKHSVQFMKIQFIPEILTSFLIRLSRLAPAIAGNYQATINYLPCRMFKNISYGQLGFSNVPKFKDILQSTSVQGESISELVDNALALSPAEYKRMVQAQQEIVKKYTYVQSYEAIFRTFEKSI